VFGVTLTRNISAAYIVEIHHDELETWKRRRPFVLVRFARCFSNLEALFDVGRTLTKILDDTLLGPRDLFATLRSVTAIGFGGLPVQGELFGEGEIEETGRSVKCLFDDGRGDGGVGQIEEAVAGECVDYLEAAAFLVLGISGEETAKVDERQRRCLSGDGSEATGEHVEPTRVIPADGWFEDDVYSVALGAEVGVIECPIDDKRNE
jgi:hypothetical protein